MEIVAIVLVVILFFAIRARRQTSAPGTERVKIVSKFNEAAIGEVFRLKTDKPNVLRFQPERPEEFTLYGQGLGSGDPVKGMNYRYDNVLAFVSGQNRRLEVEYAPTEEYPEAIKVFGVWDDAHDTRREHIGYVDAETAKEIQRNYVDLPIAAELRTIYLPDGRYKAGVRMWLLRAKYPKRFRREIAATTEKGQGA